MCILILCFHANIPFDAFDYSFYNVWTQTVYTFDFPNLWSQSWLLKVILETSVVRLNIFLFGFSFCYFWTVYEFVREICDKHYVKPVLYSSGLLKKSFDVTGTLHLLWGSIAYISFISYRTQLCASHYHIIKYKFY